MANRHLNQRLIDTLKPSKSVREVRDTGLRGFGVRILPSGRRSYFVHSQTDGRRVWTKIGDTDAMPLADARDLARSNLAASRTGDQSRLWGIAAETPFEDVADAVFRAAAASMTDCERPKNRLRSALLTTDELSQWA